MKQFILGFAFCALLTSCASVAYTSYIMDLPVWDGTLKGRKPSEDIPVSTCQPDAQNLDKCRVVLTAEWERMNSDIINLKERLKSCEQGS
jgi:hypothetical protein